MNILQITKIYQSRTTVPKQVKEVLKVGDGDRIVWYVNDAGEVCVRKA